MADTDTEQFLKTFVAQHRECNKKLTQAWNQHVVLTREWALAQCNVEKTQAEVELAKTKAVCAKQNLENCFSELYALLDSQPGVVAAKQKE
jgi:hypothetical protein